MTVADAGTVALVAVAVLSLGLPEMYQRRRALAGGMLLALALASLEVSGISQDGNQVGAVTALAVTMGILFLGLCMALSQVFVGLRTPLWQGPTRAASLLAGAALLVLGARLIAPLRGTGGWLTALGTAVAVAAFLPVLTHPRITQISQTLIRRVGELFSPRAPETTGAQWDRGTAILLGVHALAALTALVAPQLHLFMVAVLISLVAGVLLERHRDRHSGWPILVFFVLPAFGVAWYLLVHVAGGESLSLARLRDAPYSPAFELLAALILGLVGWSLLALWPFHRAPRGPFTPLLGAAVFTRLIGPALPEGLVHWQPILFLLVGLAAWHSAATHRGELALTALGSLGLMSGDATAAWAGVALVGGTVVLSLFRLLAEVGITPDIGGRAVRRGMPLAGALLVVPVLTGGLGAQVFYSVMTVAGIVTILWRRSR